MPAVKAKKKKTKHKEDMPWDIGTLMNNVYKYMTKKGGLLHSLLADEPKATTKKRRR